MNKQTYAGGPAPYIHEVRVGWGHCDPAQIAFTGHIPWFALEAIDAWWEVHLDGTGWFQLNIDRNVGTPFVHMSLDFSSPVTPRHPLMCEVAPVRIGTKSIEFQVIGTDPITICRVPGQSLCICSSERKLQLRKLVGQHAWDSLTRLHYRRGTSRPASEVSGARMKISTRRLC